MVKRDAPKKIGLMGTFGYGNLGDAAIQDAMIQHIRIYFPNAEIYGYSLDPEDTQARHGIKSFPISRISWKEGKHKLNPMDLWGKILHRLRTSPNPILRKVERWIGRVPVELGLVFDAYRNLRGLDTLIISGGGQLDDYWGGGGPWSHPYTLLKWGALARLRGAKYKFVSVGAGPINSRLSRVFLRWALSLAEYRSYRDQFSKELIESIGIGADDPVYPDLAHSLIIPDELVVENAPCSRRLIGIGPIGYFKRGCWPEEDEKRYADYLGKLASFVTWLVERQYAVVFLVGEIYFDQLVVNDLKQAIVDRGIALEHEQIIETSIQTVDDLITLMSTIDLVVASRFHNLLLAQLVGKPVLALSYQSKIDALMADTGQANFCFPIDQFDLEKLKEGFLALETNREAIRQQIAKRVGDYQNALKNQYELIFVQP